MRIKEQTSERHMFERDWTTSSKNVNSSTLDGEHNWEDLYIQLRNPETCTSDSAKLGREGEGVDCCRCFIVNLLIQCAFCCVNLFGRSWGTWERNLITPTYMP